MKSHDELVGKKIEVSIGDGSHVVDNYCGKLLEFSQFGILIDVPKRGGATTIAFIPWNSLVRLSYKLEDGAEIQAEVPSSKMKPAQAVVVENQTVQKLEKNSDEPEKKRGPGRPPKKPIVMEDDEPIAQPAPKKRPVVDPVVDPDDDDDIPVQPKKKQIVSSDDDPPVRKKSVVLEDADDDIPVQPKKKQIVSSDEEDIPGKAQRRPSIMDSLNKFRGPKDDDDDDIGMTDDDDDDDIDPRKRSNVAEDDG